MDGKVYAFFNRYSKQKMTLVKRVKTFLFFNFFSGFLVIVLSTRILDTESANDLIKISMVIIFLVLLFFWLMSLMTSFKIQKEIAQLQAKYTEDAGWQQEVTFKKFPKHFPPGGAFGKKT